MSHWTSDKSDVKAETLVVMRNFNCGLKVHRFYLPTSKLKFQSNIN